MFDEIPEAYKSSTADNEEEGWRLQTQGDKNARPSARVADARDHVAPAHRQRSSRGAAAARTAASSSTSPWIKEKLPNAEEHIKRKLPSMYHQFMKLANVDNHQRSRWKLDRRRIT